MSELLEPPLQPVLARTPTARARSAGPNPAQAGGDHTPAFPAEFAELLTPKGRRLLRQGLDDPARFHLNGETPLAFFPDLISKPWADRLLAQLEREMTPHMRLMESRIPPESISGMVRNYAEQLPKSMRVRTAHIGNSSQAARVAKQAGLQAWLRSESLHRFAEAVTGLPLETDRGLQAILYRPGDYSGPHNDHHPESEHARRGYVDIHFSFTNPHVLDQLLVCEAQGHLSQAYTCSLHGSVAVYRLPFWHYTTPLRAKPGREADARRWLLLVSFHIRDPASGAGG